MGRRIAAKITGVAGYVPPRVVTNLDLEKRVDTSDEWIRTRTGIRERHYADPGVASSHLGAEAARKVLAARAVSPAVAGGTKGRASAGTVKMRHWLNGAGRSAMTGRTRHA